MEHKLIAKNTLFQLLAKTSSAGIGLIITIIMFAVLGRAGYGQFTTVTVAIGFCALFLDFGLNAIFLQSENQTNFQTLFSFRLLLATALVLIFVLFSLFPIESGFFKPFAMLRFSMLLYSLSLFPQAILLSASALFQKKLRYHNLFIATMCGSLVTLTIVGITSMLVPTITSMLVSYLFGGIITAAAAFWLAKEKVQVLQIDTSYLQKLLSESAPLGAMLLFNLIYFRVDTLILTSFSSISQVGDYGLAYRFFDFLIAIPLFLSNSLYPLLLRDRNFSRTGKLIVMSYVWLFLILSLFLLIISWFLVPFFLQFIKQTDQAVVLFHLLLLSLPFFFLTSFLQWLLIAYAKQRFLVWVYVACAVVNIVLNFIFIPQFGAVASATITGVSELLVLLFLSWKARTLFKHVTAF